MRDYVGLMLTRRRFLAGASASFVVTALGRGQSPRVRGEEMPELPDTPYRIVSPGLTNDGFYPDVHVSFFEPYQGGAIYVTATNALSGFAQVFGRTYLLTPGPEGLAGFVGFGVLDPPGPATLTVSLNDTMNEPLNYGYTLNVRRTQWTFDDIIIPPPDPNAPPSPPEDPPLVDEQPRLNALYAGILEIGQHAVPGRIPTLLDFSASAVGSCVGIVVVLLLLKTRVGKASI